MPLLRVLTSEYTFGSLLSCCLFLMAFPLFRPPSPSKMQEVGSVVSPIDSTLAAPAESSGSGSAKGQSASGQNIVPKFVKAKRFVLKHSSQ